MAEKEKYSVFIKAEDKSLEQVDFKTTLAIFNEVTPCNCVTCQSIRLALVLAHMLHDVNSMPELVNAVAEETGIEEDEIEVMADSLLGCMLDMVADRCEVPEHATIQ